MHTARLLRIPLVVLTFVGLFGRFASAQTSSAHTSGFAYLKNGGGAEITALGDLHVAGLVSPEMMRMNPAAAALLSATNVSFDYALLPVGGNTDLFSAVSTAGNGFALGISAFLLRDGELEVRTAPTVDPLSTSIPQNFSLGATAAFRIDSLALGLTLKWLNQRITVYNADGYALDFGAIYNLSGEYQLGFAISDLGKMGKLLNESSELPTRGTLTLAATPELLSSPLFRTKILLSAQDGFEDGATHITAGVAEEYDQHFTLRLGYLSGDKIRGLSFGAGIHYGAFALDYAFAPSLNGFNSTNVFGLTARL